MNILNSPAGVITDLNNLSNPSGWYKINHDHNVSNTPDGYTDGFIWIMRTADTNIFQLAIPHNYATNGVIYLRLKWAADWLAWKNIALT